MAPHLHNDRRRSSLQVPLENSIAIALLRNKIDSSSKKTSKNSRLMNLNESVSFGSNVRIHQIVSPISNSDFFNFFLTNIYYGFFFIWQTEKKTCFGPIRILFSFSTAQTEKIWGNNS